MVIGNGKLNICIIEVVFSLFFEFFCFLYLKSVFLIVWIIVFVFTCVQDDCFRVQYSRSSVYVLGICIQVCRCSYVVFFLYGFLGINNCIGLDIRCFVFQGLEWKLIFWSIFRVYFFDFIIIFLNFQLLFLVENIVYFFRFLLLFRQSFLCCFYFVVQGFIFLLVIRFFGFLIRE